MCVQGGGKKCVGSGLTFWIWRRDANRSDTNINKNKNPPKKGTNESFERLCADVRDKNKTQIEIL